MFFLRSDQTKDQPREGGHDHGRVKVNTDPAAPNGRGNRRVALKIQRAVWLGRQQPIENGDRPAVDVLLAARREMRRQFALVEDLLRMVLRRGYENANLGELYGVVFKRILIGRLG